MGSREKMPCPAGRGEVYTRGRSADASFYQLSEDEGTGVDESVSYPEAISYLSLGQKLKGERLLRHLTQEQVAERLGITPAFVGHIERGDKGLSLDTLIRFCNLYSVTIDYLLADVYQSENETVVERFQQIVQGKSEEQIAALMDVLQTLIRHI